MEDDIFETTEVFSAVLENLDGTTPTDPLRTFIVLEDDDSKLQIIVQWNPILKTLYAHPCKTISG
jgi:hypothetical protein